MSEREFVQAADTTLTVRRTIAAEPEVLFNLWTDPRHLIKWWGPTGVACVFAEVDPRVGGSYCIDNQLPDGHLLRISGRFERVTFPDELVFSWSVGAVKANWPPSVERVSVRFERVEGGTEVIVQHERITDTPTRDQHREGWIGCLDGLANFAGRHRPDDTPVRS